MKSDAALVASLYVVALAMRLVPLTFSPLPFNIDGFPLAKIAQGIGASGSWALNPADVNSYNMKLPVYPFLWTAASSLAGADVLASLQLFMPFLLASVVLSAYLLGAKATRHRAAAYASGLFAAAFGSFLFLTSAAMKESVGLLILPVVVLLFAERADPRKRGLACLLLLVLPLLHHLTTLLALGMVSALVVLGESRRLAAGRFAWRHLALDIATGPLLALPAYVYYADVKMGYLDAVATADAMALFLAVTVLLAAALARIVRPATVRAGRLRVRPANRVVIVPVLATAVLVLNARTGLFAGVLPTQPVLLEILPAVLALMGFAVVGFQLVRRTTNRANDIVLSMLVAPTALVLFAFLRGLDPLSQVLVYRTFDFLDFAFAILVGVGFAWTWRRLRGTRASQLALGAALLGLLLATTPMAWNSQAVFGVDNVTTPAEFQALAVLAALHPANVSSDQRLADVGAWWFGLRTDASLPYLLGTNGTFSGHDYALVLERWSTVGAQEHPAPNVLVPAEALASFLAANRVVYVAGAAGDRIYIVQILAAVA